MQATRIAKGGGADEALLVRPDGIVLEAPTSTIFWVTGDELRTPALRRRDPRLDHPRRGGRGAPRRPRASTRSPTCSAPARRSSPRPSARSSRSRRSTAVALRAGPAHRARRRRPSSARSPTELGTEAARMIELTDEQRLIAGDGARLRRQRGRPEGARLRPRREVRHRARAAARRDGLPRRPGRRGVRRPRARLHRLRADRRGGRARRLGDADRGLRPDLARLRLDRALGQRGAEAALAADA